MGSQWRSLGAGMLLLAMLVYDVWVAGVDAALPDQ